MIRALVCCLLATLIAPAAAAPEPKEPAMIEVVRLLDAAPEEIFEAWTTPEDFAEVFEGSTLHEVELRPGGAYEIHWVPDAPEGQRGSEGCEVLSFVPDRMLSFSWNAPPSFDELREERTFVVVTLEPLGPDRTRLTLRHMGFGEGERWTEARDYFAQAWPWVLDRFAERFGAAERGSGYLILLRPTRDGLMETGPTPEEGAAIQRHFVRLQDLTREGVVLFAGPCTDGAGPGVVIVEAASEAEAERLMKEDPAVAAGVMTATLHPISFSLLRERDRL